MFAASTRVGIAALVVSVSAPVAAEPRFGVMTDVGVPDGATASFVYRPIRQIQTHIGVGHNGISPGVRGGVSFVPFRTFITPIAVLDYGRYFEGDANPLARMISGDATFQNDLLNDVGYDYINAHVGVELGGKRFKFYLHAGLSRVSGNVHNLNSLSEDPDAETSVSFTEDPHVTMTVPSARLGFIYLVK